MTQKSKELFERSKKVTPGGVHSPVRAFRGVGGTPRFIESAQGVYLKDVDGNSYIDYCMSWGPLIFGHQDEEIAYAVKEAMNRGWTFGTCERYSLELAEYITSNIPWVEKIRFVNSGTEAVMSALRVARAATKRNAILKFSGCYHGHTDSMLVKAGSGLAEMANPDSAGVTKSTAAETIIIELNDVGAIKKIFETRGKEIAAVIIEPLPANNGLLIQKEGYLKILFDTAHKYGALVIFDEVISGFRVAFGGMSEITNLKPDLVTYGKVIGGGFPVGAFCGRTDLMDQVAPAGNVYQAGTLSANPVAMCAGLATLKKLKRTNPFFELDKKTKSLTDKLENTALSITDAQIKAQQFGSLFWLVSGSLKSADSYVRDTLSIPDTQKNNFAGLFHKLLDRGFYLAPSGYEVGFMSTAHTEEHNNKLVNAFSESLKELKW